MPIAMGTAITKTCAATGPRVRSLIAAYTGMRSISGGARRETTRQRHDPPRRIRNSTTSHDAAMTAAASTVIVTGASGNLGRAVADAFARRGANLVVVGQRRETLVKAFGAESARLV